MSLRTPILAMLAWLLIAAAPPVRLPKGAAVAVELAHGVSAKTARTGDRVTLRVIRPVSHRDTLVIPAGSTVIGSVAQILPPKGGRPGAVVIDAEAVMLEEGGRIALTGTLTREGQDYRRDLAGGSVMAGGTLVVPLGRRGASPNLEAGTAFVATTARDY